MSEKLCLSSIKSKYNFLTRKEKQVADFILNNFDKVAGMSISDLATSSNVVKSVVVRCCKSLGFNGYSEFKIALATELAKNKKFNYVPYIASNDSSSDILDKIFSANIKTLHDTSEKINRKVLSDIIEALYKAKNIYIYGIGTSAGIVNDFQYRLMQLGYTVFGFVDIPSMKVSTLNIKEGDVAFGISNSGRTAATVDALRLAHENGAKTICITSYEDSIIAKECDFPIVIYSDEIQYPIEAISARIAHISVLDTISISLSSKRYDEAVERAAKTRRIIDSVRYR